VRNDSGFMSPTYPVGFPLHLTLATWLVGSMLAALSAGGSSTHRAAFEPQTSMGRSSHWGALVLPIFSELGLTADERSACHDVCPRHALCGYARPRAHVVDYYVRSRFWHRSTYPPDQYAVSISDDDRLRLQPLRIVGAALGAVPAGLFVLYLNFRLFGSPLTTGYGSPLQILQAVHADPTEAFSVIYVCHHVTNFACWIFLYMGPLVPFALALPFFRHARTRGGYTQ